MAVRDISKYIIEINDNGVWQQVMELSDDKLFGKNNYLII